MFGRDSARLAPAVPFTPTRYTLWRQRCRIRRWKGSGSPNETLFEPPERAGSAPGAPTSTSNRGRGCERVDNLDVRIAAKPAVTAVNATDAVLSH